MRLFIKSFISKYDIYDENDIFIGEVKKRAWDRTELTISNAIGKRIYTVQKDREKMVIKDSGGEAIPCPLFYKLDSNGARIQ